MSILALIVIIAVCGLGAYAAYRAPFIPDGFKYLIYCVLAIVALIVTLKAFGVWDVVHTPVPKI